MKGRVLYSVVFCCFMACTVLFSSETVAEDKKQEVMKRAFLTLFEPSAVVALSDKEIIIFEDEGKNISSVHSIAEDSRGLHLIEGENSFPDADVDDIEGAARAVNNDIFAITSHSRTKKGERHPEREQLLVVRGKDIKRYSISGLSDAITDYLKKLYSFNTEQLESINIEGLTFSRDSKALLIGLRNPTYKGKAILISLTNIDALKAQSFSPQFTKTPFLLDVGGEGIRAISYDRTTKKYYIASEAENKKGKKRSRLWAWDGTGEETTPLKLKGMKKLKNIEGITVVSHNGERVMLLVCDDGNKKKGKGASYALIGVDQLKVKKK